MNWFVKLLTGYKCSCGRVFNGDNYAVDAFQHIISNPTHTLTSEYTSVPSIGLFIFAIIILGIIILALWSELKATKRALIEVSNRMSSSNRIGGAVAIKRDTKVVDDVSADSENDSGTNESEENKSKEN